MIPSVVQDSWRIKRNTQNMDGQCSQIHTGFWASECNMNSPYAQESNSHPSYAGNCNMKSLTWSTHVTLAPADNMLPQPMVKNTLIFWIYEPNRSCSHKQICHYLPTKIAIAYNGHSQFYSTSNSRETIRTSLPLVQSSQAKAKDQPTDDCEKSKWPQVSLCLLIDE